MDRALRGRQPGVQMVWSLLRERLGTLSFCSHRIRMDRGLPGPRLRDRIMSDSSSGVSQLRIQLVVFALVSASFANVYITQPVLPILQSEFGADMLRVSFTVSAVILGIALANLPFGSLADRLPVQPLILTGGLVVGACGLLCAMTHNLWLLIAARFVQGVFIPALTTCLAAYLARTLPCEKLNVVMGAYVSASVLGGLGGRLLGGWIHPPLHWRYAFVSASLLIFAATILAVRVLPRDEPRRSAGKGSIGYRQLLMRADLVLILFCAAGSFSIFSSVFNYLPFRLGGQPFGFSTEMTTLIYLVYIVGIFMGPLAGRISNRFGGGNTLLAGTVVLGCSLWVLGGETVPGIIGGLFGVCAGFFCIHAAAVGLLNRKLDRGQGRANALYVLFYYVGGWCGITGAGVLYERWGWQGVLHMGLCLLAVPLIAGMFERIVDARER